MSTLCQFQVITCVKHFLTPRIHWTIPNQNFTLVITTVEAGYWLWWTTKVMLTFYTSWRSIGVFHYANAKSSDLWNIFKLQEIIYISQKWFWWWLDMVRVNQVDVIFLCYTNVKCWLHLYNTKSSHLLKVVVNDKIHHIYYIAHWNKFENDIDKNLWKTSEVIFELI